MSCARCEVTLVWYAPHARLPGLFSPLAAEGGDVNVASGTKDGLVVCNDAGIIQFTNRNLNRLFGYSMGELVGLNVSGELGYRKQRRNHCRFDSQSEAQATGLCLSPA